jgi:hypothetical protein
VNECSACRQDFGSLSPFDAHRVGRFPQRGPADYRDRLSCGLADPLEDWTPELGRRCLEEDELRALGWKQDRHGRWRQPLRDASLSFAQSRWGVASGEEASDYPEAA